MPTIIFSICSVSFFPAVTAATPADSTSIAAADQGYRIDQPGTITFTVGVKISGKVEKPQVMIFLPKEKTQYREEVMSRSFIEELSQPLPFTPITE
ncbi:MAG: hypothetical protein JW863_09045 [Chitinispirillaceae bacterium]|nr:hypothetical protein [Chitinispirillaceae bacterium]